MATASTEIRTESRGSLVSGIAIAFVAASSFVILLRLYTRLVLLKTAGKDDWAIFIAMVLSIVVTISTCQEVKYGMGRHSENVSPAEGIEQLKFLLISVLPYNVSMNVVKISFLFQYRRIFQSKRVQLACLCAMVAVIVWACVQATLLGVSCFPIAVIVPSTAGFCLNTLPIWYFSSAMSLATDILIFCIPLPSVLKLQLPLKQKIMVSGIFCLGFFVCIISVYRMFTLHAAVYSTDPSWENIGAAIWSSIELNTAIICACLPTLRPLISRLVPGSGFSSAKNNGSSYPAYGSGYGSASGTRRGTFKELKSAPRTISTEELALNDMSSEPEHVPGVYSHITSNTDMGIGGYQHGRDENQKRIMVTTETRVRVGR